MYQLPYRNRTHAGKILAQEMMAYLDYDHVLVLALPRGGVPVAYEVARALDVPMDVLIVRKLGIPGHEEAAMGAIASGGRPILNRALIDHLEITRQEIEAVIARERQEINRREQAYRDRRPQPRIEGRTILLIDDGLATGATMRAAVQIVASELPSEIIVGVPIASEEAYAMFKTEADDIICPAIPDDFLAVGRWYMDFPQVSDEEVRTLLKLAHSRYP